MSFANLHCRELSSRLADCMQQTCSYVTDGVYSADRDQRNNLRTMSVGRLKAVVC